MFAACALCAGLLVPAIPLAAQEAEQPPAAAAAATTLTPGNVRPDASLTSSAAGGRVSFDASGSTDADGSIAAYEWDLNGDSLYETRTGAEPRVQREYPGGTTLIASVRVTDDAGASDDATSAVAVVAVADDPQAAPAAAPASDTALVPTGELSGEPRPAKPKRERPSATPEPATVRAAASGSVTIKDFSFGPATVNVNAGDTVTWSNRGPTVHTATASDGSFDSGNLTKGQSYSRKFSSPGTFSYICTPHPFMKGKVVVAAAGASSSGSGGSGGGDSGSGSESGSGTAGAAGSGSGSGASSGGLAKTGADLVPWSLFGFSLLAFGAALRFRLTD